jgi:hypothetical protein
MTAPSADDAVRLQQIHLCIKPILNTQESGARRIQSIHALQEIVLNVENRHIINKTFDRLLPTLEQLLGDRLLSIPFSFSFSLVRLQSEQLTPLLFSNAELLQFGRQLQFCLEFWEVLSLETTCSVFSNGCNKISTLLKKKSSTSL